MHLPSTFGPSTFGYGKPLPQKTYQVSPSINVEVTTFLADDRCYSDLRGLVLPG